MMPYDGEPVLDLEAYWRDNAETYRRTKEAMVAAGIGAHVAASGLSGPYRRAAEGVVIALATGAFMAELGQNESLRQAEKAKQEEVARQEAARKEAERNKAAEEKAKDDARIDTEMDLIRDHHARPEQIAKEKEDLGSWW
jgi:hypothetical protein